MKYFEILNYIHSLGNFSLSPTLDRIKTVLKMLGNPQDRFKAVHIAGTNGKGSVSAMTSKVFENAGYKTALFISPFVVDFRERIQINGQFITEEELVCCAERVMATGVKLTEFEFITATAFLYFSDKKCEIAVIETGLGGRLDATNSLTNVISSVITKIGLDHTAVLGDTIEQITAEKCGMYYQSVHAPYVRMCYLWRDCADTEDARNELLRCIDDSADAGVPIVVAHSYIGIGAKKNHRSAMRTGGKSLYIYFSCASVTAWNFTRVSRTSLRDWAIASSVRRRASSIYSLLTRRSSFTRAWV